LIRLWARERWARTPRRILFLRQFLVEKGPLLFFGFQDLALAHEVGVVVAGPAGEAAAVQFHDAGGQTAEEGPVVGDEEQGKLRFDQEIFQPEDGGDIEMVGGLVQQEQIGLGRQRPPEQGFALQTARQLGEILVGVELELLQEVFDEDLPLPVLFVGTGRTHAGSHQIVDGTDHITRDLLGQAGRDRGFGAEDRAGVGLHLARDHPKEGRFARPIAADQAEALAFINLQIDFIEDGGTAEAEADVEKAE
jgi:hypothetical protein